MRSIYEILGTDNNDQDIGGIFKKLLYKIIAMTKVSSSSLLFSLKKITAKCISKRYNPLMRTDLFLKQIGALTPAIHLRKY